jgi:AAA+ ATPase superfamily predicted ATPase
MRTYLRERQIQTLEELTKQGNGNAQFILLSGRRNVGKTALLHEYLVDRQGIYLTITK